MKKFIYYLTLIILLISCDAQIAKSQFERGEYKNSVRTMVGYISNGRFQKLKETEKVEIVNRTVIIDNYYNMTINNNDSVENIRNIYDAVSISYMLNTIPELRERINYLTIDRANYLLKELEYKIDRRLSTTSITKNDLEKIEAILQDMRNYRTINYGLTYKSIAKSVADAYYTLYDREINLENKLKYIEKVNNIYEEFDNNYRSSKTIYIRLKKQIDIEKANNSLSKGKDLYFVGKYYEAIKELEKSVILYSQYSEYSSTVRDAKVYIENANTRLKEQNAEKYYRLGNESVAKKDYKRAVQYYYEAHKNINNYKGSYNLAKEYEKKSNEKLTYKVSSNNRVRKNIIERTLNNNGFTYSNTANLYIDYFEEVYYKIENVSVGIVRETLIVRPIISSGTYQHRVRDLVYTHEYNRFLDGDAEYGRENMIRIKENSINKDVERLILDLIRTIK